MGLGRNYEGGTQIARKLKPAVAELEAVGFLATPFRDGRFIKNGRDWSVRFVQRQATPTPITLPGQPQKQEPEPQSTLVAELASRGVTKATAVELVKQHQAEAIERQIEILDWLMEKKPAKVSEPGAYLVSAIKTGHAAPKGFTTKAERQAREEARQAKERQAAEHRRQEQEREARDRATAAKSGCLSQTARPGRANRP